MTAHATKLEQFVSASREIRADAAYPLADFSARTGLKRWALRAARRNGLRVIAVHKASFVLGSDWLAYLQKIAGGAE